MIYFLIFVVLFCAILNMLVKKYVFYNLKYDRILSKKVVEIDEKFKLTTVIENKKAVPVAFLQVSERFPSVLRFRFNVKEEKNSEYISHTSTMFILPYQRIKRTYDVSFKSRGRFILGDVHLTGGDFIGLSSVSSRVQRIDDIIVLPKSVELDSEIEPYGNYDGDFSVKRLIIEDPVQIIGINEYTGREPFNAIHWSSSLKCGKLMVKQFDHTSDNTVQIVLNIECAKPFWYGIDKKSVEKCISIARTLVDEFEESGIPYSFICDSYYDNENVHKCQTAGTGRVHYEEILESLGKLDYNVNIQFEDLIFDIMGSTDYPSAFILITPSILKPYIGAINSLREAASKLYVISLKSENMKCLDDDIFKYSGRNEKIG